MKARKEDAVLREMIAKSGVKLPAGEIETVCELARAMQEAASVVSVPLDPDVPPATQLRLFSVRRP